MKSKLLKSIGIVILFLAIVVGLVYAFSLGTTDGTWGRIDSTAGVTIDATCNTYSAANSATYTLVDVAGVIYNTNVGPGGEDEVYTRKSTVCSGDLDGDYDWTDWVRTTTMTPLLLNSYSGCANTTGLIISKVYYDDRGWGSDRLGIQIYNATGADVNLNGYSLLLFTNDRDFTKVDLNSVNLANGSIYIAASYNFTWVTENQIFNANNAYRTIVLLKDYVYKQITAWDTDGWPESVQAISTTDENEVRYGSPSNFSGACPNTAAGIELQSGFGFEGQTTGQAELAENELFPVGRFCHYNNPISLVANMNYMNTVPLFLTINDVTCPAGQTYVPILPAVDNNLKFEFLVSLDETPNDTTPCRYGPTSPGWPRGSGNPSVTGDLGPNRNGCADAVTFSAPALSQSFKCQIPNPSGDPLEQEYTVSILGFTPSTAGAKCPAVAVGAVQFPQLYTAERAKNCYCVYAAYTKGQITPVTLQSLSAVAVADGILVSWETVTETNNFGFNIMRAESVDGERIQVNHELIMSDLAPGDPFGASYEYLDGTAVVGVTYYYWLIDVPLDSGDMPSSYGPISAVR